MSDVSNVQATAASTATTATNAAATHANAGTANTAAEVDSSQTAGNMAELKEVAPEVYDKMMQGVALKICNDMKSHQDRIKKIMRENRQQA